MKNYFSSSWSYYPHIPVFLPGIFQRRQLLRFEEAFRAHRLLPLLMLLPLALLSANCQSGGSNDATSTAQGDSSSQSAESNSSHSIDIDPLHFRALRHIHFYDPSIRFKEPESFFPEEEEHNDDNDSEVHDKSLTWPQPRHLVGLDMPTMNDRALTLYLEDYREEALALMSATVQARPEQAQIYLNAGRLAVQEKNKREARSVIQAMVRSGHFPPGRLQELSTGLLEQRPEGPFLGVTIIEETLSIAEEPAMQTELLLWLAIRAVEYDRDATAIAYLSRALKATADHHPSLYLMAGLLHQSEKPLIASFYYLAAGLAGSSEPELCMDLARAMHESYPEHNPAFLQTLMESLPKASTDREQPFYNTRLTDSGEKWVSLMAELSSEVQSSDHSRLADLIQAKTGIYRTEEYRLPREAYSYYSPVARKRMQERANPKDVLLTEVARHCAMRTGRPTAVRLLGQQILRFDDVADLSSLKSLLSDPMHHSPSGQGSTGSEDSLQEQWKNLLYSWYATDELPLDSSFYSDLKQNY